MAWVLILTTTVALVVLWIGWLGYIGKLKPNRFVGIVTGYTRESEENWRAVHRAAGPFLVLGSVAAVAAGLAFLPFALTSNVPGGLLLAVIIAQVVILIGRQMAKQRQLGALVVSRPVMVGLLAGFAVMYATGLLV